ncbi:hypothetical protein [Streptomyces sp. NPDC006463]
MSHSAENGPPWRAGRVQPEVLVHDGQFVLHHVPASLPAEHSDPQPA